MDCENRVRLRKYIVECIEFGIGRRQPGWGLATRDLNRFNSKIDHFLSSLCEQFGREIRISARNHTDDPKTLGMLAGQPTRPLVVLLYHFPANGNLFCSRHRKGALAASQSLDKA